MMSLPLRLGLLLAPFALANCRSSPRVTSEPAADFTMVDALRIADRYRVQSIAFGNGPTKVMMWSQMHGDEATATMALAEIMTWMTASEPDSIRDRISRQ